MILEIHELRTGLICQHHADQTGRSDAMNEPQRHQVETRRENLVFLWIEKLPILGIYSASRAPMEKDNYQEGVNTEYNTHAAQLKVPGTPLSFPLTS